MLYNFSIDPDRNLLDMLFEESKLMSPRRILQSRSDLEDYAEVVDTIKRGGLDDIFNLNQNFIDE